MYLFKVSCPIGAPVKEFVFKVKGTVEKFLSFAKCIKDVTKSARVCTRNQSKVETLFPRVKRRIVRNFVYGK